MNAIKLRHYTDLADYTNSEYAKGDINGSISIDSSIDNQGKQVLSQRSFLLCESCFWCASWLLGIDNRIKVLPFLQCPNCYNNSVKLLPLLP
jgi:hypothetical protein